MTDLSGGTLKGWRKETSHPWGCPQSLPSQAHLRLIPGPEHSWIRPARNASRILAWQWVLGSSHRKEWRYTQKPLPLVFLLFSFNYSWQSILYLYSSKPRAPAEVKQHASLLLCPWLLTDYTSKWAIEICSWAHKLVPVWLWIWHLSCWFSISVSIKWVITVHKGAIKIK